MPTSNRWSPAGKKGTDRVECRRLRLAALLALWAASAWAGDAAIPHLDARGQAGYQQYLAAGLHRAFVIAPGGAWAWKADESTAEAASEAAQEACRASTEQACVPYAVDGQAVFDARAWPTLWGPYANAAAARQRPVGTARGQRFPDLVWRNAAGKPVRFSELRGKVVVLHFWGSWCGPCRREMPELHKLYKQLGDEGRDIRLVPLQVREDFTRARLWAEQQRLNLPLNDLDGAGEGHELLTLAGGGTVPDREIARVFPSTFVIDRHGLVVFSHAGPLADWPGYLPFLRDVAARSGR